MAFVPCAPFAAGGCHTAQLHSHPRTALLGRVLQPVSPRFRPRRRPAVRFALEPATGAEKEAASSAPGNVAPSEPTPVVPETVSVAKSASPKAEEDDQGRVPFEIRGFSLANVGLIAGAAITLVSFSSYFGSNGTASATSLGFVYGVPVLLVGCALKYAELQPVPLQTTSGAVALRESKGNATQKKIISDITRHRYGDEAHLSVALASLGLVAKGMPCPQLIRAAEFGTKDGGYCLALDFVSLNVSYSAWEERKERYERFFGPGVTAETEKLDEEKRIVQLRLIAGR